MANYKEPINLATIDQGITTKQFRAKLAAAVRDEGGSTAAGLAWDVAPQHIGSALSGAKLPTPRILEAMGYESVKEILYRYKEVK